MKNNQENEKGSADGKMKILNSLRKEFLKLDEADKATLFPQIEQELKDAFFELEDLINKIKQNKDDSELRMNVDTLLSEIREKADTVIREKQERIQRINQRN